MRSFPRILPILSQARRLLWDDTTVVIYGTEVFGKQVSDKHFAIRRTAGPVPDDVKQLMESLGEWKYPAMRERVADGVQCFVPLVSGTCAGFCWVTRAQLDIEEVGVKRPLPPGQSWIFHCHITAAHRGHGLYPAALRFIVNDMAAADQSVAWIGAKSTNLSSLRGIQKAGFREIARIRRRAVCGVTIARTISLTQGDRLVDAFPIHDEGGRGGTRVAVFEKDLPVPSVGEGLRR